MKLDLRSWGIVLVVIACLLSSAACQGQPAVNINSGPSPTPSFANSPEGAVRAMLNTIEQQDANRYLDAIDPMLRAEPNYFFKDALIKGIQSYLGLQGVGDLSRVAFREVELKTRSSSDNLAVVDASGKVRNLAVATETAFAGEFYVRRVDGIWYVSDPGTVAPSTVEAPQGAVWKLIPISIEAEPRANGFLGYHVVLMLENQGSKGERAEIDTGAGILETEEGFTYPVDSLRYSSTLIPPGFRVRGDWGEYASGTMELWFKAVEKAHPTKVVLEDHSTVDIGGVLKTSPSGSGRSWGGVGIADLRRLSFPTSRPNSDFLDTGLAVQVLPDAKVTFKNARRAGVSSMGLSGHAEGLIVDVEFQNENQGYARDVNASCVLFDGLGLTRTSLVSASTGAGPGQTVTTQIGYYFGDCDDDEERLKAALTRAKLVCSGDFEAIVNIEVR